MNPHITIQKITPDDWEDYKKIRLEALQAEPQAYMTTYEQAKLYSDEDWKKYTTTATILIAKTDTALIGTIGAYYKTENNKLFAVVIGVYLNKDYRGKGMGRQLLDSVIEEIKREGVVKTVKLWVNTEQVSAVKLYERSGFKVIGTDNIILGDGKPHKEYIMEKAII